MSVEKEEALNQAQEVQLKETVKDLDFLLTSFCIKYAGCTRVLEAAWELVSFAKEVSQVSHKFDYAGLPANGFRSLVRKMAQLLLYSIKAPAHRVDQIADIFSELQKAIPAIRPLLYEPVSELPGLEIDRMVDAMHCLTNDEKAMDVIFGDIALRFDFDGLGNFLTTFAFWFISFVISDSWIMALWCLFSSSARRRAVREYYRTCPFEKLVHLLSWSRGLGHGHIMPFLAFGFSPSVRKTVQIPRQRVWEVRLEIEQQDVKLMKNERLAANKAAKAETIECCILRQDLAKGQPDDFEGVVLVYVHGGGFISNSIYNTNNFLPAFCKKLPGLTVLTVGLSLAHKRQFPAQIQETLDVYLWLQSQQEAVSKVLGFHPKSFIFSCDSSGAVITMSTLVVLNDMNRLLRQEPTQPAVVMPLSVVAHFPAFHVVAGALPSLLLGVQDLLLFPTTLTQMCFSYMPNISPPGLPDSTVELQTPSAWFLNPPETTKALLWRYEFLFKHPYFSPVYYDRFEDLSSTQLHVLACHEDPILDSSILMLRRWKGKTSFHVSSTLRHAYFYFTSFAKTIFRSIRPKLSEAEDIFVAKLYESVQKPVPK